MEYALPFGWLLLLSAGVAIVCEILRYGEFRKLHLDFQGGGGQRYAYYTIFMFLALLASMAASLLMAFVSTYLWRQVLLLPSPQILYVGALVLILAFCAVCGLLYLSLSQVMELKQMVWPVLAIAALEVVSLAIEPLRWFFCGTLFFLASLAWAKKTPFTSWRNLTHWAVEPQEKDTETLSPQGDQEVRVFIEAEGILARWKDLIEVKGEELARGHNGPADSLAQRLLDETRISDIVTAQEQILQRKDLLEVILQAVTDNMGKLRALLEASDQSKDSLEEKEKRLKAAIQDLLRESLAPSIRSRYYWRWDLPQEKTSFFVHRVPQVQLSPILSFRQYLGVPLTRHEQGQKESTG